jgi:hypothetical protein
MKYADYRSEINCGCFIFTIVCYTITMLFVYCLSQHTPKPLSSVYGATTRFEKIDTKVTRLEIELENPDPKNNNVMVSVFLWYDYEEKYRLATISFYSPKKNKTSTFFIHIPEELRYLLREKCTWVTLQWKAFDDTKECSYCPIKSIKFTKDEEP